MDRTGAADRLEVGPRTIRRDVDKLRSLGYPVQAAPGVAGGYRLAPAPNCRRCCWMTPRRSPSPSVCASGLGPDRRYRGDLRARADQARAGAALTPASPCECAQPGHIGTDGDGPQTTPRRWRRWRVPAATRCASTSPTSPPTAPPPCAPSTPQPSCTAGVVGIWSRLTSIATTGALSGSTGSTARCGPADAVRRARSRAAIRPSYVKQQLSRYAAAAKRCGAG